MNKLISSIPANNEKIIELYNKLQKGQLNPSPGFQRKLVWRKQHKFDFIDTILTNFPFPEVYIAPGKIDSTRLLINEFVVDGQQRLTTIKNYINGLDVFGLGNIPIKKFDELSTTEKEDFLGYEVSVRYLKNASSEQIADIFQRINRTEYALNSAERLNAEWGESEFVCFAKQIVEEELALDPMIINYNISIPNRKFYLNFFHTKNRIFTDNDNSRMLSLQFVLTLVSTIIEDKYFNRNLKVQSYIESQFDEVRDASIIDKQLVSTLRLIDKLRFDPSSYWFNKANVFTLIVELYKYDSKDIDLKKLKVSLELLENDNVKYLAALKSKTDPQLTKSNLKYIEFSREGVNSKDARDYRGSIISKMIKKSIIE